MNRKGQTLAIFVVFLPIFIMIGTFVIDLGLSKYNDNKLDNITKMVIKYGLNNIESEPYNDMVDLIYQNDSEIDNYNIEIDLENRKIKMSVDKATNVLFGNIFGKSFYKQKSSYVGYIKDENIIIERDDTR